MKKTLLLAVALCTIAAGFSPARAHMPGVTEPVLRPDTQWVETSWGYRLNTLDLNPAPPAGYPRDYRWPTLMETEGYAGAGTPNMYLRMDDGELMAMNIVFGRGPRADYAYVKASVRGTECSGGSYNLYDRRHAWDGYHEIEWIAAQPWSNAKVGLHGSSLSGQTAYWIAATQPPHLAAVSPNALHSDIYRDIFMVGGIQNNIFPVAWTYGMGVSGPHRLPLAAAQSGTLVNDEICAWNVAVSKFSAPGDLPQPENEAVWAAARSVDDDWYTSHAAITYAPAIKIPYYQQVNWQDEQVGPRAVTLFNYIHPTPREITDADGRERTIEPKTFSLSSGDHGFASFHARDLWNFLDIWLLGKADVAGLYEHKIYNYFETREDKPGSKFTSVKTGDSWPFRDTAYPKLYLHENGVANFDAPAGVEATDTYVSAAPRYGWFWYEAQSAESPVTTARGYPDQVAYQSAPLDREVTVDGPVMMNLWAKLAGTDTDFYVSVADVFPNGDVSYIQRGLLKASHRQVDSARSLYAADGRMVQPYMPHTNPQPVTPLEATEFKIEIFPIGHIFRPGHRMLIQIHTPPAVEGLWGYTPTHHQPSAVTILHDADHPSWVQLPEVRVDAVQPPDALGTAPAGCKIPGGFPCVPPSALTR
jgi:putative CocE/NonD family hydrolase